LAVTDHRISGDGIR